MSANKVIRAPLWATLLAALVAAMVVVTFFVFVQSGEAAPQAADEQPSAKTPKIIGGTEVPNGKYPFVALLHFHKQGASVSFCGGSLIDQDSVLTAAHCFLGSPKGTRLQVIVGRTVRTTNQGQVRSVKSVSIHPKFNPKKGPANDAAVVNLSRPVTGITPIELATSKQNYLESPGRNATAAGWGNTIANPPDKPGGPHIPLRMHEVQLPIVSDSRAERAYDPRPETQLTRLFTYSPPLMLAAGGKGKDTCQGDSGGPLFVALGRNGGGGDDDGGDDDRGKGGSGGKYTQIGITSFGAGCGAFKGVPGVYTEVNNPSIRSFITNAASK